MALITSLFSVGWEIIWLLFFSKYVNQLPVAEEYIQGLRLFSAKISLPFLGLLLLTWINFNPIMDK